jgi:hypothetical protein
VSKAGSCTHGLESVNIMIRVVLLEKLEVLAVRMLSCRCLSFLISCTASSPCHPLQQHFVAISMSCTAPRSASSPDALQAADCMQCCCAQSCCLCLQPCLTIPHQAAVLPAPLQTTPVAAALVSAGGSSFGRMCCWTFLQPAGAALAGDT